MSDLKLAFVVEKLAQAPFQRTLTVHQLADEGKQGVPIFQLIELLHQVMLHLDDLNPQSFHRGVDLRTEGPSMTVDRMLEFLRILKFKGTNTPEGIADCKVQMLAGDRPLLLSMLQFLLTDMETHKKRAYLAPFLTPIDVAPEFRHDDHVQELTQKYVQLQDEFKQTHKQFQQLQHFQHTSAEIKREIRQMEEEKQSVLSKIAKWKVKLEAMPDHLAWLEVARRLRLEQEMEWDLSEKAKEEVQRQKQLDSQMEQLRLQLSDVKQSNLGVTPEMLLAKLRDESKLNRYLATDKLPSRIQEHTEQLQLLQHVLRQPKLAKEETSRVELQVKDYTDKVNALREEKLKLAQTTPSDDRVQVFRQQATMIARKKESLAEALGQLMQETTQLSTTVQQKQEQLETMPKMLKGEEFKQFASALRNKSALYKDRKQELSELTAEVGVLHRTQEVLKGDILRLKRTLGDAADAIHEKNAEKLAGKSAHEITTIVLQAIANIREKKNDLTGFAKQLKAHQQSIQENEYVYQDKKRQYDAVMMGTETENTALAQEIRRLQNECNLEQSQHELLACQHRLLQIQEENVLAEMKSYIGGDPQVEKLQKQRGFKTYRDLYTRKIAELEVQAKQLREQQKDVKTNSEAHAKQKAMMQDVMALLQFKMDARKKREQLGMQQKSLDTQPMSQDRLVL